MGRLERSFFEQRADAVARGILARYLAVGLPNGDVMRARLREVAAYEGATKTTSRGVMYGPGVVSISVKFGQCLLDIATGREGEPACVTLRAADFEQDGREVKEVKGPGNVCRRLGITRDSRDYWTGAQAYGDRIWIEGEEAPESEIVVVEGNSENCLGFYRWLRAR